MITLKERLDGMFLGLAAGDALGAPVENKKAWKIKKAYKGRIKDFHPARGQEAGFTTDDTALSVCLAESLVNSAGYDKSDAMSHYLHWFNCDGRGMGSNTKFVFTSAMNGLDPFEAAELFSYLRPDRVVSNGALMRMGPMAFYYHNNEKALEEHAHNDTKMTHYHDIASQASLAYVSLLANIFKTGKPVVKASGIAKTALQASETVTKDLVDKGRGMALVPLAATGWAVNSGLDFEEAVIRLVNWGGDADTNGAIAGAVLGAYHGPDAIPARWKDNLIEKDYFLELSDNLYNTWKANQTEIKLADLKLAVK